MDFSHLKNPRLHITMQTYVRNSKAFSNELNDAYFMMNHAEN